MHISNSEERQLSLPITLSSSGDDHLLTARADDEHFKGMDFVQCHDNRGFQYNLNNNNKLLPRPGGSGKSQSKHESNSAAAVAVSLDELEVVIVHKPVGNGQRVITGGQQQAQSLSSEGCRHQLHTNCCHRRKRHNATQTTMATAMPLERSSCCCCAQLSRCHCHSVTTTHHHHCHHHHHYCGGGAGAVSNKRHHRRHQQQQQQQPHHHPHQHPHKLHSKRSPLPASKNQLHDNQQQVNHTKSSLDSSEEHRPYMHSAAIAIEIDAATVTENNSSTATSNFPYKVASEGGGAPMNLTPLCEQHRQRRRRGSLNSNTTIETDELSHDDDDDVDDDINDDDEDDDDNDDDDDDVHMGVQPEDEEQLTPALRPAAGAAQPSSSSSSTARAFAGSAPIRNECVRIKRKRFVPDAMQDYCSSCSRCSSCSCDLARTSSCSSLDEEMAHELTVAVDCHRCMAEAAQHASESHSLGLLGSRRSSLKSFCSCHTEGCCCGGGIRCRDVEDEENYAGDEDEDDGDEETSGQRESFCTAADHTIMSTPTQEDAHSSTLTPLSTQEHTMRSDVADEDDDDRDAITDADASSISQSAEYYSLSSTAGGVGQQTAAIAPLKQDARGASGSSGACSHNNKNNNSSSSSNWSKHIRLKDNSSPLDTHL